MLGNANVAFVKPSIFPYGLLVAVALLTSACATLDRLMQPRAQAEAEKTVAPVVQRHFCNEPPPRKVLVTAFPLRYPEQIKSGEFMDWASVTGVALGNALESGPHLKTAYAISQFPFVSAESAPQLELQGGKPLVMDWAAKAGAQYVVAGVFKDFGVAKLAAVVPERNVKVETFIFDVLTGKQVARKEFAQKLFFGDIPKNVLPGSSEFESTRLGKSYRKLIADMAAWTEDTVTCQPFPVKVARVEGDKVYLEMGSDRELRVGMTLQSWRPGTAPPPRHPGVPASAKQLPTAVVKLVQANQSVAEIPRQRFPPVVKPGDILYVSNGV